MKHLFDHVNMFGLDKETTTSTPQQLPAPVAQQPHSDSSKRSSFRARLSQKFSNKKLSPVMAKKEQNKGIVILLLSRVQLYRNKTKIIPKYGIEARQLLGVDSP